MFHFSHTQNDYRRLNVTPTGLTACAIDASIMCVLNDILRHIHTPIKLDPKINATMNCKNVIFHCFLPPKKTKEENEEIVKKLFWEMSPRVRSQGRAWVHFKAVCSCFFC